MSDYMTKILVTGGAGFIGSNFVRYMVNKYSEYEIINLDALTYCGNLENLKDIEDKAKELGYERMYLETHDNLAAALHVYKKCGYKEIEKPTGVVHATMNRFFIKEFR